jgi:hypothetical protein
VGGLLFSLFAAFIIAFVVVVFVIAWGLRAFLMRSARQRLPPGMSGGRQVYPGREASFYSPDPMNPADPRNEPGPADRRGHGGGLFGGGLFGGGHGGHHGGWSGGGGHGGGGGHSGGGGGGGGGHHG